MRGAAQRVSLSLSFCFCWVFSSLLLCLWLKRPLIPPSHNSLRLGRSFSGKPLQFVQLRLVLHQWRGLCSVTHESVNRFCFKTIFLEVDFCLCDWRCWRQEAQPGGLAQETRVLGGTPTNFRTHPIWCIILFENHIFPSFLSIRFALSVLRQRLSWRVSGWPTKPALSYYVALKSLRDFIFSYLYIYI